MRDRDTIDAELRRLSTLRRSIRERGGELPSRQLDALLDERLGHPPEVSGTEAVDGWPPSGPYRRHGVLRRLGLLAAPPLSLVAVAAVCVVLFAVHRPQPAVDPPPEASASASPPPPAAQPPPKAPGPSMDIVDKAFIDTMRHQGVPVPSTEYVLSHGRAVCDFAAQQPGFQQIVQSVQQSSIWDADQSTDVAAGAIASYCPEYRPGGSAAMQQTLQNILADLQAIEGNLQGFRDQLPAIPGR